MPEELKQPIKINGKYYCHCVYEFKDRLKAMGKFKFEPSTKLWYLMENDFTHDIFNKTHVVRYTNHTTIGAINYYFVYWITSKDDYNSKLHS